MSQTFWFTKADHLQSNLPPPAHSNSLGPQNVTLYESIFQIFVKILKLRRYVENFEKVFRIKLLANCINILKFFQENSKNYLGKVRACFEKILQKFRVSDRECSEREMLRNFKANLTKFWGWFAQVKGLSKNSSKIG